MRLGVDFSEYGGPLALSTVNCWKTTGVKNAVVQYSNRLRQHLDVLGQAGDVEREMYVYLYWGTDPWGQTPMVRVQKALNIANGDAKRIWLDAEDSTHPFQADQLAQCEILCWMAGVPPGIYTGRWFWQSQAHNIQTFKHLPLWDARYIGEAPIADLSKMPKDLFTGYVPYGGWPAPMMHQWWNTNSLCNHSVDLNVLGDIFIPEEENEMIPFVARADYFNNKGFLKNTFANHYTMLMRSDLGLPPDARMVHIQYKPLGSTAGKLKFFHGDTDIQAPLIRTYDGWYECDVRMDNDGEARFIAEMDLTIRELCCSGYSKGG